MNRRALGFFWLMAACVAMPAISRAGDAQLSYVGKGEDRIPVVVVSGTPYEMGKQFGEATKDDSVQFLSTLMERIQIAEPKRFAVKNLDAAWESLAPYTDNRFKEELRGLSDGTGIPLKTLQRAHVFPAIADYACSGIAVWGSATKDGHLYQTRNLDWEMGLTAQEHPCIVVYRPDQGIPHVNVTFTGCIGSNTGMNAEGIVLSEMGDSPGKEYPFDLNGTHFTTLFRTLLYDADSLDKALSTFQDAKRIKKYHFVVGDGKNKQAAKIIQRNANPLIISKDNDPKDEHAPNVAKDLVYQDEGRGAFAPLKKVYGKIGPQDMIDIACKIPIKGGNILDVVYDATALEFWVAYAEKDVEAYQRPFVHVKLKDYLK